jgi:hypothetical protein
MNVELPHEPGRLVAIGNAQLAASPVAVGVDRRLGHAEFAGDLLRTQMLVDKPQAFALALGKQLGGMVRAVVPHGHDGLSKRRLGRLVYFSARFGGSMAFGCGRLTDR